MFSFYISGATSTIRTTPYQSDQPNSILCFPVTYVQELLHIKALTQDKIGMLDQCSCSVRAFSAWGSIGQLLSIPLQISVTWRDHFINALHRDNKFLNGFKPNYPPVEADFEERAGQPPKTLSMEVCDMGL